MDSILNCRLEDMEDYYSLLGCDELSTVEQIVSEFKVRALECHPDKHPGNPNAVENFQKLQQAKEILTNEDSRTRYDYWRRSNITIPFQQWEALSNSIKTSMHWAVRHKKEPMLESPDLNLNHKMADDCLQQAECNHDGIFDDKKERRDFEISDGNVSPNSPGSPVLKNARRAAITMRSMRHVKGSLNSADGVSQARRELLKIAVCEKAPGIDWLPIYETLKSEMKNEASSGGFSDPNCWHLRFRWSGDTPSELLRKFRNYEI